MLATRGGGQMFKPLRTAAALPAQDMARAKAFYRDKLGLTPTVEDPGGVMYALAAGHRFWGCPRSGKPAGAHPQLGHQGAGVEGAFKAPPGERGHVRREDAAR